MVTAALDPSAAQTEENSGESPPSYEAALVLPSSTPVVSPPAAHPAPAPSTGSVPRVRRQSSSFLENKRRLSIEEGAEDTSDGDNGATPTVLNYGLHNAGNDSDDEDEAYSVDDEAFEPYEEAQQVLADQEKTEKTERSPHTRGISIEERLFIHDEASPVAIPPAARQPPPPGSHTTASPRSRPSSRGATRPHFANTPGPPGSPAAPVLVYDDQTYSIVSKLRALNRQLTAKIELQSRQLQSLQDDKKLDAAKIETLERDVRMLKHTIRSIERHPPPCLDREKAKPPTYASLTQQQQESAAWVELPPVGAGTEIQSLSSPRSPRVHVADAPRPKTSSSLSPSPRKPGRSSRSPVALSASSSPSNTTTMGRGLHTAPASSSSSSPNPDKLLAAKVDKLEQEKRELQNRHAHQLANYSHELSRLERQIENAQKLVQAKDYELRLQKSRQLYVCCGGSGSSSSSRVSAGGGASGFSTGGASGLAGKGGVQHHHHHASMLSDSLWRELLPSTPPASTLLALPFTSHVGLAFEQLLDYQLLSFHDHMVDATTRDWLHEIRRCGTQVLQMHHTFQCMALTFKKLAECTHIYDLAETFTNEVQQLTKAEHAFLFVMDPAENEFWCRVPRNREDPLTSCSSSSSSAPSSDMITVRSRVMPISGAGGVSAVAAEHTGTTAQHTAMLAASSGHAPCGLASWVFHTKKPLLIPAGHVTKNAHFSTSPDNTDRFMHFKSASTLLMPIIRGTTTLGVIQVCGKLTHVAALGVSISLEKCEAFTAEDQVCLTMLGHFLSGILPKAAYFTEVESNKVNEETLIQLAPEIFTCLRFEELGKIVIQNAKEILDADRCSLFVADNDERMLFNWQSDISGKGGVEVINDVKKSTMRIPFGHGMVGMVAETRQLINIPDAYEDSRFNSSWDKKTNYRTKSILTVPILTTTTSASTASKPPIRRRRSQHDVYGAVILEDGSRGGGAAGAQGETNGSEPSSEPTHPQQMLLGVVQVINKSGGAPFRSKDEFLLLTISKLIALAIENSQLFQKTQELCASLGKLVADADLVEAVTTLGACAEDIIGVESAAIYVLAQDAGSSSGATGLASAELFTFHRKRRHKIVIKEQMYRHSLLEIVLRTKELVLVNDVSPATPHYNAYVDSIGGIAARNVLFMPLLIDDPEDATQSTKKMVGVLHLVNTRGRKLKFEQFDLFLSIVSSQTCSVLASILEKQAMLRQQEQTRRLLDTTLSFFKEMSPVGIINAVYNTCASLFAVEKAHLFLWEPDRRAMWTAKLSPNAQGMAVSMVGASDSSLSLLSSPSSGSSPASPGGGMRHAPSLRSQARRISVLTDQKIRVPTSEGLLEHVLSKSSLVVVKHWVEAIDEDASEENGDGDEGDFDVSNASRDRAPRAAKASSVLTTLDVSKYMLRACRSDYRAGFTKHAVVACPVWDIYGLEIVGVVVLFFPKGRAPSPSELTNLPLLSRQISGALNVCDDLRAVTQRSRTLQDIVEVYSPRRPASAAPAISLTLSARGQLVAFSQPLNVATLSFSVASLLQFVPSGTTPTTINYHTLELTKLPLDDDGNRWVFVLSAASLQEMTSEHFVNWIGKDVGSGAAAQAGVFDKLRTDLQSVYVRKETARGVVTMPIANEPRVHKATATALTALPRAVQLQLRLLLWEFADAQQWKVDIKRACKIFDAVDPTRSRLVSRQHLEFALTTHGRAVELDQMEWDLLHTQFADPETDLTHVERMFQALAPQFKVIPSFQYELTPVLDTVTQSVISVHVLLTATKPSVSNITAIMV